MRATDAIILGGFTSATDELLHFLNFYLVNPASAFLSVAGRRGAGPALTHGKNWLQGLIAILLGLAAFLPAPSRAAAPNDIPSGQRVWFDSLDTLAQGYSSTTAVPSNPGSGSSITTWLSKINGYNATQAISGTTAPKYSVSTTGIGALYSVAGQALSVSGDIWGAVGTTVPLMDHFTVASSTNSANTGFLWGSEITPSSMNRLTTHFPWAGNIYFDPTCCLANRSVAWTLATNRLYMTNWFYSYTANSKSLIVNGTSALMNNLTTVGNYSVSTGAYYSLGYGEGNTHAGLISEDIVYNRLLYVAEKRIINNYLSAKWGIAIGTESRYTGNTSANGLYRYHVGGIGMESDGSVAKGTSEGLTLTDAGFLGSGRYLLAGLPGLSAAGTMSAYDQSSSTVLTAPKQLTGTVSTNLPAGVSWRGNRVWFLSKTDASNTAGKVSLAFDVTGAMGIANFSNGDTVALLYRASATANFQVLATASYSGSPVSFAVAGTSIGNGYYTIGKVSLPIPQLSKTVSVESDPLNGTTLPKNLPGAWIRYKITLSNLGDTSIDANTISISDSFPNNLDLFVNALSPSTFAVLMTNPSVGTSYSVLNCGLTLSAANVTFYDSTGAVIATPSPDGAGFASAVRSITIAPQGTLAAAAVANTPPYPSCSFEFRLRVH